MRKTFMQTLQPQALDSVTQTHAPTPTPATRIVAPKGTRSSASEYKAIRIKYCAHSKPPFIAASGLAR